MEEVMRKPSKVGQICRIINPLEDENPSDVFIIAEDPAELDDEDSIYVVSLPDLQRNIAQPFLAPQTTVQKDELTVIAESLEQYISS